LRRIRIVGVFNRVYAVLFLNIDCIIPPFH
jgi:hypothetical protein